MKMEKIRNSLGMRSRIVLSFILFLTVTIIAIWLLITQYNQKFIRSILTQDTLQQLSEINYRLDVVSDTVNQLYITLSSNQTYSLPDSSSHFSEAQRLNQILQYEYQIKEILNTNHLQSVVTGCIFYVNESEKYYVGNGAMDQGYILHQTPWYQSFLLNGEYSAFYGPLQEDFRSENSRKDETLYWVKRWNIPQPQHISKDEIPVIVFCLDMDYIRSIFFENELNTKNYHIYDQQGNFLVDINAKEGREEDFPLIDQEKSTLQSQGWVFTDQWFICKVYNERFGWQIYSVESTEDMFVSMNQMIRTISMIIIIIGMVSAVLMATFSRKIVLPITLLNRFINTIEEKNDTFIEINENTDVGQIGKRFNQMKQKLQEMSANMYLSQVSEKDAQLSALQTQINPHFLYNTLDNIFCIAQLEQSDTIATLVESLSNMMRYSIDMQEREVPVSDELAHVMSYINIINVRYDDSIQLIFDVPEELMQAKILKLTLQPLVENAWIHGIIRKESHKGIIRIQAERFAELLMITIADDGVGIDEDSCHILNKKLSQISYAVADNSKRNGVALENVNQRIKLTDGPEFGLHIYPGASGGCTVEMKLKYRE